MSDNTWKEQQAAEHAFSKEQASLDRALAAREGAKDRATSYVNEHKKQTMDMTADHTGGAMGQLRQFGDNSYQPKGFKPIDFTG